jgi:hypothetical protein
LSCREVSERKFVVCAVVASATEKKKKKKKKKKNAKVTRAKQRQTLEREKIWQ